MVPLRPGGQQSIEGQPGPLLSQLKPKHGAHIQWPDKSSGKGEASSRQEKKYLSENTLWNSLLDLALYVLTWLFHIG